MPAPGWAGLCVSRHGSEAGRHAACCTEDILCQRGVQACAEATPASAPSWAICCDPGFLALHIPSRCE